MGKTTEVKFTVPDDKAAAIERGDQVAIREVQFRLEMLGMQFRMARSVRTVLAVTADGRTLMARETNIHAN